MIRLKELKEHYRLWSTDRGKTQSVYELAPTYGSYSPYKYLATIEKEKEGWYRVCDSKHLEICHSFKPTNKIEQLIDDINTLISSYEYSSEHYNPMFRDGYFEEIVVHDELRKLGFKSDRCVYSMERGNIIGGKSMNVVFSINGLEAKFGDVEQSESVSISFFTGDYAWTEISNIKRNPKDILAQINATLKKIYLIEAISCFKLSESFVDGDIDNIEQVVLSGFNLKKQDFKQELIDRLENTLKILKK